MGVDSSKQSQCSHQTDHENGALAQQEAKGVAPHFLCPWCQQWLGAICLRKEVGIERITSSLHACKALKNSYALALHALHT